MFSSEIENLVIKLLLTIINKEKEIEINTKKKLYRFIEYN